MSQFHKCLDSNDNTKSHAIRDEEHIFTRRNTLEFKAPFIVEDDAVNKKTEISIDSDGGLDLNKFEPPKRTAPGISKIINLEDIGIQNPVDGQMLVFNGTSRKWVNGTRTYSAGEHIVGKWIDNQPIYEKTITNLNISIQQSSGWKQVLDLSNYNINTLIDIKFKCDATVICNFYKIRINTSTKYLEVYPAISSTESSIIVIKEITIQYTKNISS
jgi:hypothetical protein